MGNFDPAVANETTFTSTITSTTSTRWLSPVEAFRRFAPSERLDIEARDAKEEARRYGFRVGELGLLIGATTGCEVVPAVAIARIPNTADWLRGVTNLRGNLVPVFDLGILLTRGGDATETGAPARQEKKMILVMGRGDRAAGLLIDGYPRAVGVATPLQELPPLPEALVPHVDAGYLHEGVAWVEFRHEELFAVLGGRIAA